MKDLVIKSSKEKRYYNGILELDTNFRRGLIVKNTDFRNVFKSIGVQINPDDVFIVRILNMEAYDVDKQLHDIIQPVIMYIVSQTYNQIRLKGICIPQCSIDFSQYEMTLHLNQRNVVKYTLKLSQNEEIVCYDFYE